MLAHHLHEKKQKKSFDQAKPSVRVGRKATGPNRRVSRVARGIISNA